MSEHDSVVYQISSVPKVSPLDRPTVIAMTSKAQAQKLIAQLATQQTPYLYKVATFENNYLPTMER